MVSCNGSAEMGYDIITKENLLPECNTPDYRLLWESHLSRKLEQLLNPIVVALTITIKKYNWNNSDGITNYGVTDNWSARDSKTEIKSISEINGYWDPKSGLRFGWVKSFSNKRTRIKPNIRSSTLNVPTVSTVVIFMVPTLIGKLACRFRKGQKLI